MKHANHHARRLFAFILGLTLLTAAKSRAQYHSYSVPSSGGDCIMQDYRSPDVPAGIYDAIHEDDVLSLDGGSGYFYGGFTHQNLVNGSYCTLVQYVCWPAAGWFAPYCQQIPYFAGTNEVGYPQTGEGSSCAIKGYWPQFTTNLWTREVMRFWQPGNGTPHVGYQGIWIKEPVSGNWYHVGTFMYPFAVNGVNGMTGWQENFSSYTGNYIVDHAGGYYHTSSGWQSANKISYTSNGYTYVTTNNISPGTPEFDPANPTTTESAVGPAYTGLYNNPATWTLTNQPAQPSFDPIVVTNYSASTLGSQLLVQWQLPPSSSPQLGYLVEVFTNSSYTGSAAVSFHDNDPEVRQKLLDISGVTTPYVRLTISDIFFNTNAPVLITPVAVTPSPAATVSGAVGGLGFQYYEAASGNWTVLPNFSSLTPVYQGAVSFTDATPRRKRINYGFNYTGYITVPTDGLYAFTLHSGDGSALTIDGTNVISFDGLHDSTQFKGGGIALAAGAHTFNVQYFKGAANPVNTTAYTDGIGLAWEGPGIAYADVPYSAYSRIPAGSEPSVTLGTLVSGSTLCSSNLSLSATVSANGNTINKVLYYLTDYNSYYFRPSQGFDYYLGSATTAPYTLNVPIYAAATNAVRARIFYNSTNVLDSAVSFFTATNMSLAPWQVVGNAPQNYPVGGSSQGGTYKLTGDNLSLMAEPLKGDCTIVAHLASLPSTSGGAPDLAPDADGTWLAGIIMRSTTNTTPGTPLADGSTTRETCVFSEPSGGTYYANDLMLGGNSAPNAYSSSVGSQRWFKIQRVGNQFTNSVSTDGTTWTVVNSTNLATIGSTCYACLFLYQDPSQNPNLNVATFDNVSITGNLIGPATVTVSPSATNVYAGTPLTLTATAGGTQPYAYQWQLDGVNLAGATNATLTFTNLQPANSGNYTVVMTDGDNATAGTNARVNVLYNSDPAQAQVAITSPVDGAAFPASTTLNLSANVTTNGHAVSAVEFFNGATLLGSATAAPYTYAWANVPTGTYTLIAWVLYDGGSSNSSVPVVVSANPLPATPANLNVFSPTTNLISISWSAAANATGYVLTRDGAMLATVSGPAYQDFSIVAGSTYCYSVVATNGFGSSSPSATVCGMAAATGNALFWDAGGSPDGPQDGSDYWSTGSATWWNGATNVVWADNNVAVIGTGATTNCTVTITNNVIPNGIIFGAGSGSYTLASSSAQTVTLPAGTGVTAEGNATITASIYAGTGGAGTFLSTGPGTLTIAGSGLTCTQALVSAGTLQVQNVTADCPYIVTNNGTLEIGYTTGGGYANTGMKIYGAGAAATSGFYLAGGQQYNTAGEIQLLSAPTTIRQYGSGLALISIFDINSVGIWCSAAASGSATDPNIEMINEGYGMSVQVDAGVNTGTGDFTINGPLSAGNQGFYKRGTGSLLLNGVATSANINVWLQAGTITCGMTNCLGVNAGVPISSGATLNLNGFNQTIAGLTNSAGGTVNFGGAGTLTASNAVLAGALQMSLNKGATPNCSQLIIPGHALTYGGSLVVTNLSTNTFAAGDTFQLFNAASYSGSFGTLSLPPLPSGLGWITNLNVNGSIQVASGVPTVLVSPTAATNFAGGTVTFSATASGGTPPYAYQWQFNGVNISGATSSNLTLVNLQLASSGLYTVVVPGVGGSGTGSARLEVTTVPSGYAVQVLAASPLAYWRLNEPAHSTTAYDLMGNYNGTISATGLAMGAPGVGNSISAAGFETTNTCATFTNNVTPSILIPAMTALNTNTLTVVGWVYRNTNEISSSAIFCENSGSTIRSGLKFGTGNALAFTWNSTTLNTSTLIPPSNQWAFVAWVMTSTNGKIYMGTNLAAPVMQVYTNTATEAVQNFGATTPYLGYNAAATADRFGGLMDEVAVYNHALTYQQITNLWLSSTVTPNPPTITLVNPADSSTYLTATTTNLNLGATVITNGHAITAVNFYAGTNLVGASTTAPYSYTWSAGPGTYSVYAQVVYENGAVNSSLPVLVTVNALPAAPAATTAEALGTNLVLVQWPPGGYGTSYIINRGDVGTVAVVPATTTNYLDFNVAANGTYCYSVMTSNSFGISVASPTACATVPATGTGLVWDTAAAGSHPQDGSGNWGTSASDWWNGVSDVAWVNGSVAVFGAAPGGSGTATLTNSITPGEVVFNASANYIIAGSSYTINTPTGHPLTVEADGNGTVGVNFSGSSGLVKTGLGTLSISAGSSGLTGTLTVSNGILADAASDGLDYVNITVARGATFRNDIDNSLRSTSSALLIKAGGTLATSSGITLNMGTYGGSLTLEGGAVMTSSSPDSTYGSYSISYGGSPVTVAGGDPTAAVISALGVIPSGSLNPLVFNVGNVTGGGTDLLFSGTLGAPANTTFGITKTGVGTMAIMATTNTYTGTNTVSAGTLLINGSVSGACTVQSTASLGGTGFIAGVTTVLPGGSLAPGAFGSVIGKLIISNTVSLSGQAVFKLAKLGAGVNTNDSLFGITTNTFGGSLAVTNIGTNALVLGDSFKLFTSKTNLGSFATMTLPSLPAGLTWSNSLSLNGTIWVTNLTLTLNYIAGANGTLSGSTNQTVTYGANGTAVTAVANSGYSFANWSDGSTANPRTDVNVTSNLTVSANFVSAAPPVISPGTIGFQAGNFTLGGTGVAGQSYVLLSASNLLTPVWIPIATNTADTNGVFNLTQPNATNGQQFYRVRSP